MSFQYTEPAEDAEALESNVPFAVYS